MKADYHIHTHFSTDSEELPSAYCEQAMVLGLDEIAFTDHVDLGVSNMYAPQQVVDYPFYQKEMARLKQLYSGRLVIRKGLELGVQLDYLDEYRQIVKEHDLDFIIMSCHQIDNQEFWLEEFQQGKTSEQCFQEYYTYLLKLHEQFRDDYDVLGHLDLMKRYSDYTQATDEEQKPQIIALLKKVIEDGKGIEVNTSGIRYKLGDVHPGKQILTWYYELGGQIITLGSDAHKVQDLAKDLSLVREQLKAIGFTKFCTFEKRKPIFHEL